MSGKVFSLKVCLVAARGVYSCVGVRDKILFLFLEG